MFAYDDQHISLDRITIPVRHTNERLAVLVLSIIEAPDMTPHPSASLSHDTSGCMIFLTLFLLLLVQCPVLLHIPFLRTCHTPLFLLPTINLGVIFLLYENLLLMQKPYSIPSGSLL